MFVPLNFPSVFAMINFIISFPSDLVRNDFCQLSKKNKEIYYDPTNATDTNLCRRKR